MAMRATNSAWAFAAFAIVTSTFLACGRSDGGGPTDPGPDPDPNPDPKTGLIQVSTTTSGADLDPDGYTVAMDGDSDRAIGRNGVITFSDVAVGTHQVALSGLADNCSVGGDNPAGASVTAGATAQVSFDVACAALPIGSLEVTTTVTNNFDPDGYQVFVAGVERGRVDVDGSAAFDDLPAGPQQVELQEIAPNCAVDGDNPATVDIPVGGTATHAFSIICTNPPDGRIVYVGTVGGKHGLAVMNSDGSGKLGIWECPEWCGRPQWAPDGSRVAFENMGSGVIDVWTVSQDGSDPVQLTDEGGHEPKWSPDGSRLAFIRSIGDRAIIHIMNADGTNLIHFDHEGYWEASPAWSPDGTRIAFVRSTLEFRAPGAIFLMDADGSNAVPITQPAPMLDNGYPEYSDYWPVWSPDGSMIVFHRSIQAENRDRVHVVRSDGTDPINLTPDLAHSSDWPSWSPDGTRIVFDGGNGGIYTMNADGSNITEIDPTSNPSVYPNWGP